MVESRFIKAVCIIGVESVLGKMNYRWDYCIVG